MSLRLAQRRRPLVVHTPAPIAALFFKRGDGRGIGPSMMLLARPQQRKSEVVEHSPDMLLDKRDAVFAAQEILHELCRPQPGRIVWRATFQVLDEQALLSRGHLRW